jgi:cytochrome c oxidase assembly protein subunit 11
MVLIMRMPFQSSRKLPVAPADLNRRRRNMIVVASSMVVIALMGALTYYSVPLYRLFCQATGLGGTTQVARVAPGAVPGPPIAVRFDANVASNLPWRFNAPEPVEVHLGEQRQVEYTAVNLSNEPVLGTAIYNVTPLEIGKYFYKIQCFCFTEQLLMPGERKEFPVLFYVDPEIADDPDGGGVKTITLSYTFYNKGPEALEQYLRAHPVASGAKDQVRQ